MLMVKLFQYCIVLLFSNSQSNAQNCIFAPTCPDFLTWMPGYICDDGYFPIIRKKIVNSLQIKTICCSEILICSPQHFWCSTSELMNPAGQTTTASMSSCANGCVTEWKPYKNDSEPILFGIFGGFYDSATRSFIGRVRVPNGFLPGRIHNNQPGMFYTYSGSEKYANGSVEFLYSNPNYTYGWISSENGSYVANAVTLNVPKTSAQYIGRISVNGGTFIGTVVRILGGMFYSDYSGVEKFTANYEVLVCNKPVVSTTAVSMPVCPIYWKGSTSQQTQTTSAPATFPMVINAQNGILTGDLVHKYSWENLANLSANLITDVTLASLTLPGGLEYSVGRIIVNGATIAGTVDLNTGIMQYTDGYGTVQNVLCFEVLVCKNFEASSTTVLPETSTTTNSIEEQAPLTNASVTSLSVVPTTVQKCSNNWARYTENEILSISAVDVSFKGSNSSYFGQADINGIDLPGIIQFNTSVNSYCFSNFDDKCLINFQYLKNVGGNNYKWINSSNGEIVESGVTVSANYFGRILLNGTFYFGTVFPNFGIIYSTNNEVRCIGKNYQVLVCSEEILTSALTNSSETGLTNLMSQNNSTENKNETSIPVVPIAQSVIPQSGNQSTTMAPLESSSTAGSSLVTSTLAPVDNCTNNWLNYTGVEDISIIGVSTDPSSPNQTYIGQGIINSSLSPSIIKEDTSAKSYCLFFLNIGCTNSFQYLRKNDEFDYVWYDSQNGASEPQSIRVNSYSIGRIRINGILYIGTVLPGFGLVYTSNGMNQFEIVSSGYQVLTCSNQKSIEESTIPAITTQTTTSSQNVETSTGLQIMNLVSNLVQPCVNTWTPYLGDIQPLSNGLQTDDGQQTFIGRATANNDFVVGRIQIISPTGLLYLSSGAWNIETATDEYLIKNSSNSYQWISSSRGLPVQHAISIVKSSNWPMYVGRAVINSTYSFYGRVLPRQGLEFDDGSSTVPLQNYEVLTCTSSVVNNILPICDP